MLEFVLGGGVIYVYHVLAFYALMGHVPDPALPFITCGIPLIAVFIRVYRASMSDCRTDTLITSLSLAGWSWLVPITIPDLIVKADVPSTNRNTTVELWTGSLIFLAVFYGLALYGSEPSVAIAGGATMLLVQIMVLVGHGKEDRFGGHRLDPSGPMR